VNVEIGGIDVANASLAEGDFRRIAGKLKAETGIHLPDNKRTLVYSRLSKRLRALKIDTFHEYCELLESKDVGDEVQFLVKALTTNVTSFFREPHHFELLKEKIFPPLVKRAKDGGCVRIWSAGCSAGNEPYSIAMQLLESLPNATSLDVKILATDIDANMIATGRAGVYSEDDVQGVDDAKRQKFFRRHGDAWKVSPELQELVSFRELNLFRPWPIKRKFDAIFCRNVVIYFELSDQIELWQRFAGALAPEGWMMIGHSERLSGPASDIFENRGLTAFQLRADAKP